ncbi:MAG TPA: sulfite exporter TauE/SafE family protein [Streptosporangiaceae bacterium]|nr:sulfite exporter TauE/SafE family protein [Streptosporangiaceae bacterium]
MTLTEALILLATGIAAGIASTVFSLASLVSYPVLLALGLPPLTANVTNTVSLVLTGAGSAIGSGPELTGQAPRVRRFGLVTALGGATGAAVLLLSPAHDFELVVPVLIAGAAVLLLIQPRVKSLSARPGGERSVPLTIALFLAAVYVGYFGAGGGVLLLVVLGIMIDEALTRLNAIKNAISGLANFVAALGFAVFAPVRWWFVLPLAAGFLIGGWTGPKLIRRMPPQGLRVIVALAGVGLAVKLGWSAYR